MVKFAICFYYFYWWWWRWCLTEMGTSPAGLNGGSGGGGSGMVGLQAAAGNTPFRSPSQGNAGGQLEPQGLTRWWWWRWQVRLVDLTGIPCVVAGGAGNQNSITGISPAPLLRWWWGWRYGNRFRWNSGQVELAVVVQEEQGWKARLQAHGWCSNGTANGGGGGGGSGGWLQGKSGQRRLWRSRYQNP
jgi:hypothetical protein